MIFRLLLIVGLLAACFAGGCDSTSDSQSSITATSDSQSSITATSDFQSSITATSDSQCSMMTMTTVQEEKVIAGCRTYRCEPPRPRCAKCGLFLNSPGCCLIPNAGSIAKKTTPSPEPIKVREIATKK